MARWVQLQNRVGVQRELEKCSRRWTLLHSGPWSPVVAAMSCMGLRHVVMLWEPPPNCPKMQLGPGGSVGRGCCPPCPASVQGFTGTVSLHRVPSSDTGLSVAVVAVTHLGTLLTWSPASRMPKHPLRG